MARRLHLLAVVGRRVASLLVMAALLGPLPALAQSSPSEDPFQPAAPPATAPAAAASAPAAPVDPFQSAAPSTAPAEVTTAPATPAPEATCCRAGIKEVPLEETAQPSATPQPETVQTTEPPPAAIAAPAPAEPPAQTALPATPTQPSTPAQTAEPAQSAPTQTAQPAPPANPAAPSVTVATPGQSPATPPGGPSGAEPPAPPPVAIDNPNFVNTATIEKGGQSMALLGVVGLSGAYTDGLKGYVASAGGHLNCQQQPAADYICQLPDGTDIAMVALVNGAAQAGSDAPDAYVKEQAEAQNARRGIWATLPPPPIQLQHPAAKDTATLLANDQTYALDGIEGVGGDYARNIESYIAGNGDSLLCQPQGGEGYYACLLPDGTNIAKVALVNGAAQVAPDAPDAYRLQQADAIRNRRGIWANLTPVVAEEDLVVLAPPPGPPAIEEPAVDGLVYVGDTPTAVIDGETVFFMFVGGSGWGYWDHYHHWRGAPDRFAHHLERYHADGHGLRGYDAHGGFDAHRYDVRHVGLARAPGLVHEAGRPLTGGPGHASGGVPMRSVGGGAGHPAAGMPGHPGPVANGMHTGTGIPGHPGAAGGTVHQQPMASARLGGGTGFVHPSVANLSHATPAIHAPSGGGAKCKKC